MNIIHARPIKRTIYVIQCEYCHSIMEGDKNDMVLDQEAFAYYTTCAVCGRRITANHIKQRTEFLDAVSGKTISVECD